MKKQLLKTTLPLVFLFSLVSCGYSLKDVYKDNIYNSPEFNENYYDVWDKRLDNVTFKETKEVVLKDNNYFTSYNDPLFKSLEPKSEEFSTDGHVKNLEDKIIMSNQDKSFKNGILSKLYDGQKVCDGGFERVRVQIPPSHKGVINNYDVSAVHEGYNSGFAQMFEKQYVDGASYFAIYFKNTFRVTSEEKDKNSVYHNFYASSSLRIVRSSIDLKISFFLKRNDSYVKETYIMAVNNINTNSGNDYRFIGFPLRANNIDLTGCNGIAVEYEIKDILPGNNNSFVDENGNTYNYYDLVTKTGIDGDISKFKNSLLLYEVLLPYASWK